MKLKQILSGLLTVLVLVTMPTTTYASNDEIKVEVMNDGSVVEETDESYIIITGENENIMSINNASDNVIGMTDEEIVELYNEYLALHPSLLGEESYLSEETLNGFAQYAVDNGIIEDNAAQRSAVTKAVVRTEFKVVVAGGEAMGLTTASKLLEHSLQDSPANLAYSSSTSYARQILYSTECKAIINDFKSQVEGTDFVSKVYSGSTTLDSTTDLHLAYNKVSYTVSGKKNNGTWTLTITFKDTYDFESQPWKNTMTDADVVTVLNNYAAYAQSLGAIVPYNVQVTVQTTFAG